MRFLLVTLGALALVLAPVGQAVPGRESRQLGRRDDGGPLIGGPGPVVNPPKPLPGDDPAGGGGRLVRRVLESRQLRNGPGKRVLKARQIGALSDILNLQDLPADALALLMSDAVQSAIQATQAILDTSGDNEGLTAVGQDAQAALQTASASIANIQSDVAAGKEPDSADRAAAEQGVREAAAAIDQLSAAVGPNPDPAVSQAIDNAKDAIGDAVAGSQQALELGGDAGVP